MTEDRLVLAEKYREEAVRQGLIIDSSKLGSHDGLRLGWYIGEGGDMFAHFDIFKLVKLILLGEKYLDEHGSGDHLIMLENKAWVSETTALENDTGVTDNLLYWDTGYERSNKPSISFEDWLVKEVKKYAKSPEQKLLRHRLNVLVAKHNRKPLTIFQRFGSWD